MERKLASVRRITEIEPLIFTNADGVEETAENIVKAKIDGWNIVTAKANGFKDGALVVYFEVDSIIPRTPWSEFLVDVNRPEKPIRIKTIKLKGHIAQGLALPLSAFETEQWFKDRLSAAFYEETPDSKVEDWFKEGEDLTESLGVTKYEIPEPNAQLAGIAKGNFPSFLRKTDEERIQNCFKQVKTIFNQPFVVTEKLDGSSFTAYLNDGVFGICSRNLDLKETEGNAFWALARKLNLEERMGRIGRNVSIQGEMVGPGIQGNKLKLPEVDLFLFNIFDIDTQEFYDYTNFQFVTQMGLELKTVPVWEVFPDGLPFESVDEMVEFVSRKSVLNDKVWAEGGVFRPKTEMVLDRFGRVSFKCISPNFLLKFGE